MDVVVVGSSNTDLISYVSRMPVPGETLHGNRFEMGFGGKGANQCVMAAKIGAKTAMVTKLGEDMFGHDTLNNYKTVGIDTSHVTFTNEASTGVAPIFVDESGQNSIVIVAGANNKITPTDINNAQDVLADAKVLLCQNEINPEATIAALTLAQKHNVLSILNLAPAVKDPPSEYLTLPSIVCVNESEVEILTGIKVTSKAEAKLAAETLLHQHGVTAALLTLGSMGSLYLGPDGMAEADCHKVTAVDTSGAGDCFIGAVAHYKSKQSDMPWDKVLQLASEVAAISVTKPGTQSSYPTRSELPSHLVI
eukprot:TRINITY_DN12925_c0_g1_i1.p1 TRINITY_DN12925_c0_g1~~TRINITY_DN12925_c0_g1_i1.p1  ORF type:complete len:308 (+),score=53.17 TRINITY_DN12925_c0_g1_i1:51-974(+)